MATLLACKDKSLAGWLWGGGQPHSLRSQGCDQTSSPPLRRPQLSFPLGCSFRESPSFPGAQMGFYWVDCLLFPPPLPSGLPYAQERVGGGSAPILFPPPCDFADRRMGGGGSVTKPS